MKPQFLKATSLSLVGFSLLMLAGCSQQVKIPEVPAEANLPPKKVQVLKLSPAQEQELGLSLETIRQVPLQETVETTGQVQAANERISHIYAPISGPVMSVQVRLGQAISQGQILATLKSDEIGQMQADLLHEMMQVNADLKQARAQLELSQATYERESSLYQQRVSARAEMEAARTAYEKDQAVVRSLEEKAQAAVSTAQSRMALYGAAPGVAARVLQNKKLYPYITLTATRNGCLISREINTGELATKDKEVFTVADLNKVWLVGNLYEQDIAKVRLGQEVRVTLDSLPNREFPGKVSYVGSILDPQTRTLEVRIDADNPDLSLKPNMFARIIIQSGKRLTMAVPNSSLQRNGDFSFIYVPVTPHHYEERRVKTGKEGNSFTEILEGAQLGEKVVTQGTLALKGEFQKMKTAKNSQ